MRRLAPLAGAVAAFALLVPAAHAAEPRVTTSISPRPALFGDVIHAVITVRGDERATIQQGFSPFQVLRQASDTTRTQDVVVTRWSFDLQCLEARCAPGPDSREVAIAASRIRVGSHTLEARFQPIRIDPRVDAGPGREPRALVPAADRPARAELPLRAGDRAPDPHRCRSAARADRRGADRPARASTPATGRSGEQRLARRRAGARGCLALALAR